MHVWVKMTDCQDSKDLNEALEWENYYSISVDELIAKFNGATVFIIVSMNKSYWMV